jgi:hypothetical protein
VSEDKKTLLPEMLPAPRPGSANSPKERVTERARQLLARMRETGGAMAGAALLGASITGCVDYAVVDPLPPPAQACSSTQNPFEGLAAYANHESRPTTPPRFRLVVSSPLSGLQLTATRVTGGTLVEVVDGLSNGRYGPSVTLILVPETDMSLVQVEVDLGCGSASTTRRYRIPYSPPTSASDLVLPVESLPQP